MRCTICKEVIVGNGLCGCSWRNSGPRWYHWALLAVSTLAAVALAIAGL